MTVDSVEVAAPAVDTVRPWPGLDTFTEALSPFFFGRNAEVDELFRRVRRDVTTLLFGQSGLGKTSLLQAGLFPRLRWADFLPILIRLDHSPGAPPPAAQVKAAIERDIAAADLSEVTPIGAEESLWGYFHRADRRLADYARKEIVPVLVFDQFEEIFTRGLVADDRRAISQDFLGELAALVENRPPEALEQAIEADPDLVESFSFDRQDYRIVLALREDFLASLESLRSRAPSLGRNRYRLRQMTGRQGLDAILNPAPGLVPPEVAQEIIRFIGRFSTENAFGASAIRDVANEFEVEPSLLSLVCRELNERRIALGLDQIGADLLAGSRDDIIEGFYWRCHADQPAALGAFVEDQLLSNSGFRESITLDSARRILTDVGVPTSALDELVRRRLLRIEERLGIPRVEVIHDILTPVIRKSRDGRRLRQAEAAAAEREAALHRERQRVRRAYWLNAAMALLVVITIGVAWWGWSSKVEAERQRAVADEQRIYSEKQRFLAEQNLAIAVTTADTLVRTAEEVARNGVSPAMIKQILASAERAFDQIASAAPNSLHLRWRRAEMLVSLAATYQDLGDPAEALARAQTAREIMLGLTQEDPTNTAWQDTLASSYERVGDALRGQSDLAAALGQYRVALDFTERHAEKDPGNALWLRDLAISHQKIGDVADQRNDFSVALDAFEMAEKIALHVKEINPTAALSIKDLSWVQARLEETRHKIAGLTGAGNSKK